MKWLNTTKIMVASLVFSFANSSSASFLSGTSSTISGNANSYLVNAINTPLPFVTSAWSMLSTFYSQNSSFAPAGVYAVDTSFLSNVSSISNTSNGTLEVRYGPSAPGPLANNGYALAPTRVTLRGNTFYVYALTQCFTNVTDSLTSRQTPQVGTPIGLFSNSNLGTNCVYAADPYTAAINQVQGVGAGIGAGNASSAPSSAGTQNTSTGG